MKILKSILSLGLMSLLVGSALSDQVIESHTYTTGDNITLQEEGNVTFQNNVTVSSGATVTVNAGGYIRLLPEFHAQSGSELYLGGGEARTNEIPRAYGQSVDVYKGTSLEITLCGNDPEGQGLTYQLLSGPSKGMLSGTAPSLIYYPNQNYSGTDSFTYRVQDGTDFSEEATVSINVIDLATGVAIVKGGVSSPIQPGSLTLQVGGNDVVAYKYKWSTDPTFSAEISSSTPISLTNLTTGSYTLELIGKTASGLWQSESSKTSYSWNVEDVSLALDSLPSQVNAGDTLNFNLLSSGLNLTSHILSIELVNGEEIAGHLSLESVTGATMALSIPVKKEAMTGQSYKIKVSYFKRDLGESDPQKVTIESSSTIEVGSFVAPTVEVNSYGKQGIPENNLTFNLGLYNLNFETHFLEAHLKSGSTVLTNKVFETLDLNEEVPLYLSIPKGVGDHSQGQLVIYYTHRTGGVTDPSSFSVSTSNDIQIEEPSISFESPLDGEEVLVGTQKNIQLKIQSDFTVDHGKIWVNGTEELSFISTDMTIDGDGNQTVTLPWTYSSSSSIYTILGEVWNAANEKLDIQIQTYTLTYLPAPNFTITEAPVTNDRLIHIEFDTTDLTHLRVGESIDLSEEDWVSVQSPFVYSLSRGAGSKVVYLQFRHQSGIETSPTSRNITLDLDIPPPVTDLQGWARSDGKVELTWAEPFIFDLDQYEVYGDQGTGTLNEVTPLGTSLSNDWTSGVLTPGTYQFAIKAVDQGGSKGLLSQVIEVQVSSNNGFVITHPATGTQFQDDTAITWNVPSGTDETNTNYEIQYRDYSRELMDIIPVDFSNGHISGMQSFDVTMEDWYLVTQSGYSGTYTGFGTDGKEYNSGALVSPENNASWFTSFGAFPDKGVILGLQTGSAQYLVIFSFDGQALGAWGYFEYNEYNSPLAGSAAFTNGKVLTLKTVSGDNVPVTFDFKADQLSTPSPLTGYGNTTSLSAVQNFNGSIFMIDGQFKNLDSTQQFQVGAEAKLLGDDIYFQKDNTVYVAYDHTTITSDLDTTGWTSFTIPGRLGYNSSFFAGTNILAYHIEEGVSSESPGTGNRIYIGTEAGLTVIDEKRGDESNSLVRTYGWEESTDTEIINKIFPGYSPEVLSISSSGDKFQVILRGAQKEEKEYAPLWVNASLTSNKVLDVRSSDVFQSLSFDHSERRLIYPIELNLVTFYSLVDNESTTHFIGARLVSELKRWNAYDTVDALNGYTAFSTNDHIINDVMELIRTVSTQLVNDLLEDKEFYITNQGNYTIPSGSLAETLRNQLITDGVFIDNSGTLSLKTTPLTMAEEELFLDFNKALLAEDGTLSTLYYEEGLRQYWMVNFGDNKGMIWSRFPHELEYWDSDEDKLWVPLVEYTDQLKTSSLLGSYTWDLNNVLPFQKLKLRMQGYDGSTYTDPFYSEGYFSVAGGLIPQGTMTSSLEQNDSYIELDLTNNFEATQVMISDEPDFIYGSWRPYKDKVTFVTRFAQGEVTLYAKFRNAWGLESSVVTQDIVLGSATPEINRFTLADQDTGNFIETDSLTVNAFISIPAGRTVTEMMVSEDESFTGVLWTNFDSLFEHTFTDTSEGLKTLYIQVRKNGGASSITYSQSIEYRADLSALNLKDVVSSLSPKGDMTAYFENYQHMASPYYILNQGKMEVKLGEEIVEAVSPSQVFNMASINTSNADQFFLKTLAWDQTGESVLFLSSSPTRKALWKVDVGVDWNGNLQASTPEMIYEISNVTWDVAGIFVKNENHLLEFYCDKGTGFEKQLFDLKPRYSNKLNHKVFLKPTEIEVWERDDTNGTPTITTVTPQTAGDLLGLEWEKSDDKVVVIHKNSTTGNYSIQSLKVDGSGNDETLVASQTNTSIQNLSLSIDGTVLYYESSTDGLQWTANQVAPRTTGAAGACGIYFPTPYKYSGQFFDDGGIVHHDSLGDETGNIIPGNQIHILGTAAPCKDPSTGQVLTDFLSYSLEYQRFPCETQAEWNLFKSSQGNWQPILTSTTAVEKGLLGTFTLNSSWNTNHIIQIRLTVNYTGGSRVHEVRFVPWDGSTEESLGNDQYLLGQTSIDRDHANSIKLEGTVPGTASGENIPVALDVLYYEDAYDASTQTWSANYFPDHIESSIPDLISFSSDAFTEPFEDGLVTLGHQLSKEIKVPLKSNLSDGTQYLKYRIFDPNGLFQDVNERIQVIPYTLDNTPPTLTSVSSVEGTHVNQRNITLSINGSNGSEMWIYNTSGTPTGWIPFASTHSLTLEDQDGQQNIQVKLRDEVGNESDTEYLAVTLDRSFSLTSNLSIQEGLETSSQSIALLTEVSETAYVRYSENSDLSSVSWTQASGNESTAFTLSAGEGIKTIYYQFKDEAGNETTVQSRNIIYRTQSVSETASVDGNGYTATSNVTLSLYSPSAAQILLSQNPSFVGATPQAYGTQASFTLSGSDGEKVIFVRFLDGGGSEISTVSASVILDTIAPIIEATYPLEGSVITASRS